MTSEGKSDRKKRSRAGPVEEEEERQRGEKEESNITGEEAVAAEKKRPRRGKRTREKTAGGEEEEPEKPGTTEKLIEEGREYLEDWSRNKDTTWKFKKAKQVWLLRWMYHPDVIGKKMFGTLVDYLKEMKGRAVERVIANAKDILAEGLPEKPSEDGEGEGKTEMTMRRRRYKRAVKVLQTLAPEEVDALRRPQDSD